MARALFLILWALFIIASLHCGVRAQIYPPNGYGGSTNSYTNSMLFVATASGQPPQYQFYNLSSSQPLNLVKQFASVYPGPGAAFYSRLDDKVYTTTNNGQNLVQLSFASGQTAEVAMNSGTINGIGVYEAKEQLFFVKQPNIVAVPLSNINAVPAVVISQGSNIEGIALNNNNNDILYTTGSNIAWASLTGSSTQSISAGHSVYTATYSNYTNTYYVAADQGNLIICRGRAIIMALITPQHITNQGFITTSPGESADTDYVWASLASPYNGDSLMRMLISPNNQTLIRTDYFLGGSSQPQGLAYIPSINGTLPLLIPASPFTRSIITLNDSSPAFSISSDSQEQRQTTPIYGAFMNTAAYPNNKTFPFPITWTKLQATYNSTYYFQYSAPLNNTSVVAALSYVYNPTGSISVELPDSRTYTLEPGTLKFTLNLTGSNNVASDVFNNDQTVNLTWTACFNHLDTSARFGAAYTTSVEGDDTTIYTFTGGKGAQLVLRVPNLALVDGVSTVIAHTLRAELSSGKLLQTCAVWSFPYFTSSLIYDPDLSVLGPSSSSNGDGGDDNNWIVAAVLVPIVVVGMLCIVCVVLLVVIIVVVKGKVEWATFYHQSQVNFSDRDVYQIYAQGADGAPKDDAAP